MAKTAAEKQAKKKSKKGSKRSKFEALVDQKTAVQPGMLSDAINSPHAMMQLQRLVGNRQVAEMMAQATAQREQFDPPGRGITKEFGSYWIVPDGTIESYMVEGEQVTANSFAKIEKTWGILQGGSGNIQIAEKDVNGASHTGFKKQVLAYLGMLMSRPIGRALIMRLVNDESEQITIRPSATRKIADASPDAANVKDAFIKEDGTSGPGTDSIVEIDPDLKDDSVIVFDKDGDFMDAPVFLILGHELIHAENQMQGDDQVAIPASDPAYTDAEEEAAIAGTTVSENMLRAEHGYAARFGHAAEDLR
ncbi:MAG: M91 family zinc metallopeptidase [Candidatus Promineifilaceae bacterium]